MTLPNAKVASRDNSVVTKLTQGGDSLESAINHFLLWEMRSRDCIKVKRCYIDVAADLEAGILLSQIIYWHLPDKEGEQKLTVQRDGHWWLAKAREDWWNECRLTPKQFDRAIRHLEKKHLVVAQVYKWHSANTKHIRVDWAGLLQALSMLDADAEKVVGFRRREPVPISGKPQRNTSDDQEPGLPISQSCELPISQSSGFPISQSRDSLLGNSRMDYQVISELPIREFHYIDPEITSKITFKDYNSPLTPRQELGEGTTQLHTSESDQQTAKPNPLDRKPQHSELLRLEAEPTNKNPLEKHMESYLSSGEQADDYSWGKFSAAPAVEQEKFSKVQPIQTALPPVETVVAKGSASVSNNQPGDTKAKRLVRDRFNRTAEPHLPKNIDGSVSLPWETEYRGKFDPEFEKWMARSLMQYPAFQNLMAGELQIKVRKHISAGKYDLKRRDELFIEWEAMQSGTDNGDSGYGMTAKSVSRRAKIRSALCS
jgi:hypothetical protein